MKKYLLEIVFLILPVLIFSQIPKVEFSNSEIVWQSTHVDYFSIDSLNKDTINSTTSQSHQFYGNRKSVFLYEDYLIRCYDNRFLNTFGITIDIIDVSTGQLIDFQYLNEVDSFIGFLGNAEIVGDNLILMTFKARSKPTLLQQSFRNFSAHLATYRYDLKDLKLYKSSEFQNPTTIAVNNNRYLPQLLDANSIVLPQYLIDSISFEQYLAIYELDTFGKLINVKNGHEIDSISLATNNEFYIGDSICRFNFFENYEKPYSLLWFDGKNKEPSNQIDISDLFIDDIKPEFIYNFNSNYFRVDYIINDSLKEIILLDRRGNLILKTKTFDPQNNTNYRNGDGVFYYHRKTGKWMAVYTTKGIDRGFLDICVVEENVFKRVLRINLDSIEVAFRPDIVFESDNGNIVLTGGFRPYDFGNRNGHQISICFDVDILDLGTNSLDKQIVKGISVYPNPVRDRLIWNIENKIDEVNIFSINGKIEKGFTPDKNYIEVGDLQSGMYILKGQNKNGKQYVGKFIKQ